MAIKSLFKALLALSILFGLVYWVEINIGWQEVLRSWGQLKPFSIVVVFVSLMLSQYLRGLRVYSSYKMIELAQYPKHKDAVAVSLLHNAANFLLPMRLGEVFLPLLSKTKLSIDLKTSSKTLLGIRLFDLYCVFFLLLLIQFEVVFSFHALAASLLLLLFVVAPLLLPALSGLSFFQWLCPPQFVRIKTVGINLLLSLVIWSIKLCALWYLFNCFLEGSVDIRQGASAILLADLSAVLPVNGFASAGSYEFAFALGLTGFNEAGPIAVKNVELLQMKAVLNLHIFLLLTNIVSACVGLFVLRVGGQAGTKKQV